MSFSACFSVGNYSKHHFISKHGCDAYSWEWIKRIRTICVQIDCQHASLALVCSGFFLRFVFCLFLVLDAFFLRWIRMSGSFTVITEISNENIKLNLSIQSNPRQWQRSTRYVIRFNWNTTTMGTNRESTHTHTQVSFSSWIDSREMIFPPLCLLSSIVMWLSVCTHVSWFFISWALSLNSRTHIVKCSAFIETGLHGEPMGLTTV